MKRKKKYYAGGQIREQAINTGASALGQTLIPVPGVGAAIGGMAGKGINALINKGAPEIPRPLPPRVSGSHGGNFKYGGKMKRVKYRNGGATSIGPGAQRYNGPSHERGGIPVSQNGQPTSQQNAVAEVEGDETMQQMNDGAYIFSDELTVPDSDMTFAEAHEMLLQEGVGEEEIEQLRQLQEQVQEEQGVQPEGEIPEMQDGGGLRETLRKTPGSGNLPYEARPAGSPPRSAAGTIMKGRDQLTQDLIRDKLKQAQGRGKYNLNETLIKHKASGVKPINAKSAPRGTITRGVQKGIEVGGNMGRYVMGPGSSSTTSTRGNVARGAVKAGKTAWRAAGVGATAASLGVGYLANKAIQNMPDKYVTSDSPEGQRRSSDSILRAAIEEDPSLLQDENIDLSGRSSGMTTPRVYNPNDVEEIEEAEEVEEIPKVRSSSKPARKKLTSGINRRGLRKGQTNMAVGEDYSSQIAAQNRARKKAGTLKYGGELNRYNTGGHLKGAVVRTKSEALGLPKIPNRNIGAAAHRGAIASPNLNPVNTTGASSRTPNAKSGGIGLSLGDNTARNFMQYGPDLAQIAMSRRDTTPDATRVNRSHINSMPTSMNVNDQLEQSATSFRTATAHPGVTGNQRLSAYANKLRNDSQIYGQKSRAETQMQTAKASAEGQANAQDAQFEAQYREDKMGSEAARKGIASQALASMGNKHMQSEQMKKIMAMDSATLGAYLGGIDKSAAASIADNALANPDIPEELKQALLPFATK